MGFVGLIFFVIGAILLRTLGGAIDNKNTTGDPDWKNASKKAYNRTMWGWGHED
jgi:hypothetical protein